MCRLLNPVGALRPDALLAIPWWGPYGGIMNPISEFRSLPVVERIQLVGDLWDSIAEDSASFPLTEAQRNELDRRLDDFEASPADGVSWDRVKASLHRRS